ncbi:MULTISPECIES: heat-inducible transcriptional repressor HrcA [unclassified Sphingomonas]|jgi:heat-inducible transcriptional repressor|uniref:heat-inducible transcriptional repressor HrcA n=1 Tax=unclassified Sphingomonas TaxID=196159 RepID=UPI000837A03D|nr:MULTISPECIES: heat-inducible transcriptional repressor HrcA [unclassified Sphingomonas]MCH4891919.1 heat-inducible transcriptional repressor HrcA [Sphingomonas sp. SFZ2018-12]
MTSGPPITELTDRARDVFRIAVQSYLETGAPVGSRTISRISTLNLSPASIRNVMQDLEEAGLLAAPHTSAGRMPTESGLRLFVDGMMQASEPTADERAAIASRADGAATVEEAIANTTAALSGLSACAGLVLVPKREPVLREFNLVPLSEGRALAVMVGQDGSIENRVVDLPRDVSATALNDVSRYLSATLAGLTLSEARARVEREIREERAALNQAARVLVERGLAVWSQDGDDRAVLIVRGQAQLIDAAALEDMERVRQLLDELEGKEEIARLLDRARDGDATRIFIGSENKLFALSGSSVIARPVRALDGRVVGVVGVIGPTRLNYARVVPMVDFTAATLARLLG